MSRGTLRSSTNKQVTDRAGDCWSEFEGTDAGLYQIQIDHAARPSIAYGLRESFNDFLKAANTKSEGGIPAKLEDLATSGIRLVISDRNDPEGAPFLSECTHGAFECACGSGGS